MFKYEVDKYSTDIEKVEVVKETPKQYVIKRISYNTKKPYSTRQAKVSEYSRFFDTWEEAQLYLIVRVETKIFDLADKLDSAKQDLFKLQTTNNIASK
jgi:hypothetical protein